MASSDTDELTADLASMTTDDFDTMSVASYRTDIYTDPPATYALPDPRGDYQRKLRTHTRLPEPQRTVTVIIRDAHDVEGSGMMFSLRLTSRFENIFDAFKASSCKNCRLAEQIRFKTGSMKIHGIDTPSDLGAIHGETISITAYSNIPGKRCADCKKTGDPSTKSQRLDGNRPVQDRAQASRNQPIRLLFLDPNGKIIGLETTSGSQMHAIMGAYARRTECALGSLHFFFD